MSKSYGSPIALSDILKLMGGKYQSALMFYNRALMVAPSDSEELILAYGNRSALLYDCKAFQACVNDVNTCFALGCPKHLVDKLNNRRRKATDLLKTELKGYSKFLDEYFRFNETKNPQIPCASSDVGVAIRSQIPTVVAVNEVKVGKVLAVETAFAGALDKSLIFTACHHCHKMSLNLFPCETCCQVLYCRKECQQTAEEEYHRVLCGIHDLYNDLKWTIPVCRIPLKTALKFRYQCKSWDELIEATSKLGLQRMKESKVNEIFDGNNKLSMLNMREDCHFLYGKMYSASFSCATAFYHLEKLKGFFPVNAEEKKAAMRGFARLLMYWNVYSVDTLTISTAASKLTAGFTTCDVGNFNAFPLASKLRHACNPAVLAVGLNNRLALVAIQPLKPGTELTVSHFGHWIDGPIERSKRWRNLLDLHTVACDCSICSGECDVIGLNARLSDKQMRCFQQFINFLQANQKMIETDFAQYVEKIYPECCNVLAILADQPFSENYRSVYIAFKKCLKYIQDFHTSNVMLNFEEINEEIVMLMKLIS